MRNLSYISGTTQGQKYKWNYPVDHLIWLDEGGWVVFTHNPLIPLFLPVREPRKQLFDAEKLFYTLRPQVMGIKQENPVDEKLIEFPGQEYLYPLPVTLLNDDFSSIRWAIYIAKDWIVVSIEQENLILFNEVCP